MTFVEAGSRVRKGYYFSANSWTLTPMAADGAVLPGAGGEKYLRVPLLLAFALAPLMGAAFLMFLPMIGFYLAANALLVRPVVGLFRTSAREVAATVAPTWVPGEAHLSGERPDEKAGEGEPARDEHLDRLQGEIESKRK